MVVVLVLVLILNTKMPTNQPIGVTTSMVSFCDSDLINDTADCLSDFVGGFYKYKDRPDSEDVDFQMLYDEGGDCGTWSQFYKEAGEQLGKKSQYVVMSMEWNKKHRVTIISDETGYCLFDNWAYSCGLYGNKS